MKNISKIVISAEGKKIGYVLDVAVDFKTMQKLGLYIVDEETENEWLLPNQKILSSSTNFVLIEKATDFDFIADRPTLIGKEVLDENCQSYGFVEKLVFKKNKCEKIVTNKCEIISKYLKNIGENYIFIEFKHKKQKKQIFPVFKGNDFVVKIQNNLYVPEKVRLSSSFYVGKVSNESILGYNNEKIIDKGEIITKNVVEKAKKHNKLNQLFFAIKKN